MKKKLIAILLAACFVCSLSSIASAAEPSTMVTYDLVAHTRTETELNKISMFSMQEVSKAPVPGTGDFESLLADGTLQLVEEDELTPDIAPYSYDNNWTKVTTPREFPYRSIAYLKIYFPSGFQSGTGFALAPGKIVTAAHCLYNLKSGHEGETPTRIEVYFGWNNGSSYRTAKATASAFHVNDMWDSYLDANYDYGVIDIDSTITSATGRLGRKTSVSGSTDYTLTGIPYDNEKYFGYYMYTDTGRIDDWDSRTIQHSLNCCGGISGAPLYDSDYYAVGLHTWSNSSYGTATRITSDLESMLG